MKQTDRQTAGERERGGGGGRNRQRDRQTEARIEIHVKAESYIDRNKGKETDSEN